VTDITRRRVFHPRARLGDAYEAVHRREDVFVGAGDDALFSRERLRFVSFFVSSLRFLFAQTAEGLAQHDVRRDVSLLRRAAAVPAEPPLDAARAQHEAVHFVQPERQVDEPRRKSAAQVHPEQHAVSPF
jgi:hypothetical protein